MRYGSLFSGIEAATVAWRPLGWTCAWVAETDPFASAVLAHRYPDVPNLGDVNAIDAAAVEPVDLVVFGSPCQSFSVAGKRLGLDDPRGNMALVGLRLIGALRPRWVVWENVPGVLSSDGGRDFGAFLGLLGELGYGVAYRVLDAQHFGVPQRRRRVFVVGHLGDWRPPAAVLFEPESLRGDPAPRRAARERVAATIESGANRTGGPRPPGTTADTADTLIANPLGAKRDGGWRGDLDNDTYVFVGNNTAGPIDVATAVNAHGGRLDFESETFVTHSLRADGFDASEDGTGRGTPLIPVTGFYQNIGSHGGGAYDDVSPALKSDPHAGNIAAVCFSAKDHGGDAGDIAPTLRAGGHTKSHANAGVMPAVCFDARQSDVCVYGDQAAPLDTDGYTMAVAYGIRSDAARAGEALTPSPDAEGRIRLRDPGFNVYEEQAPTLDGSGPHAVALNLRGREGGSQFETDHLASLRAASGGSSRSYAFHENQRAETTLSDTAGALKAGGGKPGQGYPAVMAYDVLGVLATNGAKATDIHTALRSRAPGASEASTTTVLQQAMSVRRLTPAECEKLQGLEPGYTLVPYRGKPAADGPRYRAVGNSFAVPVVRWIGERIDLFERTRAAREEAA